MFYYSADDYFDAVTFEGGPITYNERKVLFQSINQFSSRRRPSKNNIDEATVAKLKALCLEHVNVFEILKFLCTKEKAKQIPKDKTVRKPRYGESDRQ